jgi:hypothetical protein
MLQEHRRNDADQVVDKIKLPNIGEDPNQLKENLQLIKDIDKILKKPRK